MKRVLLPVIAAGFAVVAFLALKTPTASMEKSVAPITHSETRASIAAEPKPRHSHAAVDEAGNEDHRASRVAKAATLPATAEVRIEGLAGSSDWRGYDPEKLVITLPGGRRLEFKREARATRTDMESWRGRIAGDPAAFAVLAAAKGSLSAVVAVPGEPTYEISVDAAGRQTVQAFRGGVHCATCEGPAQAAALQLNAPAVGTTTSSAAAATSTIVDVLFIYDTTCLNDAGGNRDLIGSRLLARLEASNAALANSEITNFTWNLAGVYELSGYIRSGKLDEDLAAVSDRTSTAGAFAKEKADLVGADQVCLVVGNPIDWGGIAHTPGYFSVVGWSQVPYYTLAHELAHNFGCGHDRTTASAADGDGNYAYGFRFTAANGKDTGTIMSYATEILPYFSNPNVSYSGVALGVPTGQPKAAYNAKVLSDNSAALAGKRNPPTSPVITSQPTSLFGQAGDSGSLSVVASGAGVTYQWRRNGEDIAGATSRILNLPQLTSAEAGRYQCVIKNSTGTSLSQEVYVYMELLWDSNPGARLANLSTRSRAASGADAQMAGFVVSGSPAKTLLVRASGPALAAFGVSGVLADPKLELVNPETGSLLAQNDQWQTGGMGNTLKNAFAAVGAFAWPDGGSKDSALLHVAADGRYSGVVSSADGTPGVALIEVYDTELTSPSRLTNLSTRARAGAGNEALIAGFVIQGTGLKTLLIRGNGPSLEQFLGNGVVDDTVLELYDQSTGRKVALNDNWEDEDGATVSWAAQNAGAFPWASGSADAAVVVTLRPGAYTAVVQAKNAAGVGLVEVYDVNK